MQLSSWKWMWTRAYIIISIEVDRAGKGGSGKSEATCFVIDGLVESYTVGGRSSQVEREWNATEIVHRLRRWSFVVLLRKRSFSVWAWFRCMRGFLVAPFVWHTIRPSHAPVGHVRELADDRHEIWHTRETSYGIRGIRRACKVIDRFIMDRNCIEETWTVDYYIY